MKREPLKDLAASVRARLFNHSQRAHADFQLILTRYAIERFLYRLGQSAYRERFILKGAMLFTAWAGWSPRPTRDVDLLGQGNPTRAELKKIMATVCTIAVDPDGLVFHPETIIVEAIREEQPYAGQRVQLRATLGAARINLQIDIGFGDVVTPAWLTFPALLELPAPQVLAYPRESVVAEKLEAMLRLGPVNSRMKDFYDLHLMAAQFAFEGPTLTQAMHATLQRRQTSLTALPPLALTPEFYQDRRRQTMWRAFLNKNRLTVANGDFETVGQALQTFLLPPLQTITHSQTFRVHWGPGGPWR